MFALVCLSEPDVGAKTLADLYVVVWESSSCSLLGGLWFDWCRVMLPPRDAFIPEAPNPAEVPGTPAAAITTLAQLLLLLKLL